jgi:hypothetical protein
MTHQSPRKNDSTCPLIQEKMTTLHPHQKKNDHLQEKMSHPSKNGTPHPQARKRNLCVVCVCMYVGGGVAGVEGGKKKNSLKK